MMLKTSKQIQSGRSILIGLNGYSINGTSIYVPMNGTNCIALVGESIHSGFGVRFGYFGGHLSIQNTNTRMLDDD